MTPEDYAKLIPDEASAAAKTAYFNSPHLSWQDAVDAACAAMLAAWPNVYNNSHDEATWVNRSALILPLENTNDKG